VFLSQHGTSTFSTQEKRDRAVKSANKSFSSEVTYVTSHNSLLRTSPMSFSEVGPSCVLRERTSHGQALITSATARKGLLCGPCPSWLLEVFLCLCRSPLVAGDKGSIWNMEVAVEQRGGPCRRASKTVLASLSGFQVLSYLLITCIVKR
jgi:hypothetical protein